MKRKHVGRQTVVMERPVYWTGAYSIGCTREKEGPLSPYFDEIAPDARWGEESFEKAEQKFFRTAAEKAIAKAGRHKNEMDFLIGGDLLNQIISASFSARELSIPFFGIYGACSSMAESMTLGSMLVDGGFAEHIICATSSHFATAERQFRMPLELGTPQTPTSQNTATAAGAAVLSRQAQSERDARICAATVGNVVDLGVTDSTNMGAAMAPAAAETILTHLEERGYRPGDYDAIITGDLGTLGSELLLDLSRQCGVELAGVHQDCGVMIYKGMKGMHCGGSGCGCGASTLAGYYWRQLRSGKIHHILFVATGALLSPTSVMQGESIPCIAHAVEIEGGR